MDNKLPILVFDMNKPGNLVAAVMGQAVGTLVN
jgi:uridylate kinase